MQTSRETPLAASTRRDLMIVGAFICLIFIPFMGKGWHMDEPWFLYGARNILKNPFHPFDFPFVYMGRSVPFYQESHHPPGLHYLLALVLKVTGGGERVMRLFMLPFDAAAAAALYLLAARTLRRPLIPTLIVLAAPAYLVNMPHLMGEKFVAAFGFWGLYLLARSLDEERPAWFWASAALLGAAWLFKYNAAMLVTAAWAYAAWRGVPAARLAGYAAATGAGVFVWLAVHVATGHPELSAALSYTAQGWSHIAHRARALPAILGGGVGLALLWPLALQGRRELWPAAVLTLLFQPGLDAVPGVSLTDRVFGALLAAGSGALVLGLARDAGKPSERLWAAWGGAVLLWSAAYWTVACRVIVFAVPPLVFYWAGRLEQERDGAPRLQAATLVGTLALSVGLAVVDYQFAGAHRRAAQLALRAGPERVWSMAAGGLQYYLATAGAREIDIRAGGWSAVRPGDVVAASRLWPGVRPGKPIAVSVRSWQARSPIPLRLISLWGGEAGFYSSGWGFLPFALSREPLDEFQLIERR